MKPAPHAVIRLLVPALLACPAGASAALTTLVGGSLKNGDFNAEPVNPPGSVDELKFIDTTDWTNIGVGLVDPQFGAATRGDLGVDGTRNAFFDDGTERIHALDTGYSINAGDIFNVSYVWRDAFNWVDNADRVAVSLFTTNDGLITGTPSTLATTYSGFSTINNGWETVQTFGFYTATAADAGKNLFVSFNGDDGGGANEGKARLDNFVLSIGELLPPQPPSPPSPLTGVNLFSDTFDRPDSSGLVVDASTTGMSSDVFTPTAQTTYAEFTGINTSADAAISNNKMHLAIGSGQSYAGIRHNFIDQAILDGRGFAIEAIVDPRTGANGSQDNRYAVIGVGLTEAAATSQTDDAIDGSTPDTQIVEQSALAFTIEDDGQYNLFDSYAAEDLANGGNGDIFGIEHDEGSKITDGVNPGRVSFLEQVGLDQVQDEYKVRLEFEFESFGIGSPVTLTAFIQDIQIDLDPSDGIELLPEDRDRYTFTWDTDFENYIAFGGRAQESTSFDSLMIETLLSEVVLLPGDANGDGTVDLIDLSILATNFSGPGGLAEGDFNNDGVVDLIDLSILATNFGSSLSVPEPAGLSMLGLLLVGRRRRHA